MAAKKNRDSILGISVDARSIDAVLVRRDGLRCNILGKFTKARGDRETSDNHEIDSLLPGLRSNDDDDYTLQFGGSQQANSDLFLASELEKMGGVGELTGEKEDDTFKRAGNAHFDSQLREILTEAVAVAGDISRLAFCAAAPDVQYRLLTIAGEVQSGLSRQNRTKSKTIHKELEKLTGAPVAQDRVDYLAMSNKHGLQRLLAVLRDENETIVQTIRIAQALDSKPLPGLAAFDAELSLVSAFVTNAAQADDDSVTAVVRVGAEDTLISFYQGQFLLHYDWLRSVNMYDAPETVCSRVMLHQDEQKIGILSRVLLLANSRVDELHNTFSRYFDEAEVIHFERVLAEKGLELEDGDPPLRTGMALAAAVAISLDDRQSSDSTYLNLLPAKLGIKRKRRLEFGWHTFLMIPLLFLTVFFFAYRYLQKDAEIDARRAELMMNPPAPPVNNPQVLEARVDSLEKAYLSYRRGLDVMDSLLVGSDKWSRFLETVTRATRDLGGVWLDSWQPFGNTIRFDGRALSRSRVSQFARRLDATIESVASEDVMDKDKDVRIYFFRMDAPIPVKLPEVAEFLQQQPIGDTTAEGHPEE